MFARNKVSGINWRHKKVFKIVGGRGDRPGVRQGFLKQVIREPALNFIILIDKIHFTIRLRRLIRLF